MENDQKQQELMLRFSMYEQQIKQIQEHLELVEQNILEISSLSLGLEELKGKNGSEILAPVGRGIFVKSKLIDDKLIVDVGSKKFASKSIEETKEVIKSQLSKLEEIKNNLQTSLEKINEEITEFIKNAQEKEG